MKRFLTLILLALLLTQFSANAQMTDEQVVAYAKTELASGKDQQQIAKELLLRGVTQEQIERIRKKLESSNSTSNAAKALDGQLSSRSSENETIKGKSYTIDKNGKRVYKVDQDGKPIISERDLFTDPEFALTDSLQRDSLFIEKKDTIEIFGHSIFNRPNLSFEPNENLATPQDYKIGPGDELIIDIWGYNEDSIKAVVNTEGRINISQVGPVQLNGLTINEASKKIKKILSQKYSGLEDSQSSVNVSLGKIRTIQVNIMGEVDTPGTYRLSSFSSVFHALYRANGVTNTGSLRAIKVMRTGKEVATVDIYGYLLEGKSDSDIMLQEGDIVIVPPYVSLVEAKGKVKRPMFYELKEGESLQTLIDYAGGFASGAYTRNVNIVRNNSIEKEIYSVNNENFSSFEIKDGDVLTVGENTERFANMVEVRGFVFRPDMYQVGGDVNTVKELVLKAGGLKEDAFLNRALLLREKEDLSVESLAVDLGAIMNGISADVQLKKNDVLVVSGIYELNDRGTLTINGLVSNPGTFAFTDNTTVEDLIIRAGGLVEGASLVRVDVARRIYDANSLKLSDTLSIVHTTSLSEDFVITNGDSFELEPYDIVSVRKSPGYVEPQFVEISGAVNFPGRYVLLTLNETVSDLIQRAGGFTPQADVAGARLKRTQKNDISDLVQNVVEKTSSRKDTSSTNSEKIVKAASSSSYLVSIDMYAALNSPKSYQDVILREGDEIYVPIMENTVKVIGEVMFPVAVSYVKGKPINYYINAAGGYSENAKRSRVYIVYSNGSAAKGGGEIKPGSMIIVPSKPERKPLQMGEVAAITSASSSLVSLFALVSSLFK